MRVYDLKIESSALVDIQKITDWYNLQQAGLGNRFQKTVIKIINSLNKNPEIYAIKYKKIRCVQVNKFPYLVHFFINEAQKTVEVLAVFSTSRNPKNWLKK